MQKCFGMLLQERVLIFLSNSPLVFVRSSVRLGRKNIILKNYSNYLSKCDGNQLVPILHDRKG